MIGNIEKQIDALVAKVIGGVQCPECYQPIGEPCKTGFTRRSFPHKRRIKALDKHMKTKMNLILTCETMYEGEHTLTEIIRAVEHFCESSISISGIDLTKLEIAPRPFVDEEE